MKLLPNPKAPKPITAARWIRLNLALLALVLIISVTFPVSTLSQKLSDFYFNFRGDQPVSSRVAMVLIDDAALEKYGRWPWHRQLVAQLVRAVRQQKPAALGIDILLSEPEDEPNDSELARAIHDAPNVALVAKLSSSPESRLWVDPLPIFSQAARATGHAQAITDPDGLCRSIPIMESSIDGPRAAFALKLAELLQPQLASLEGPRDSNGSGLEKVVTRPLLIDFRQQYSPGQKKPPFVTVSAGDLLAGQSNEPLRGKAGLIGFGGSEISDRLFTPVSDQMPMPGVEINANVLDMLLSGRSLTHISLPVELLLIAGMSALSLWLVVRFPGVWGLLAVAAIVVAGYFAAYFVFLKLHWLLSYAPFILAGVLAAPIAQLENLLIVDREVTSRLRHLRSAIKPQPDTVMATAAEMPLSDGLHWKLAALKHLQDELGSLYTFNQTLLETMREALAVYGADGVLKFSNQTWKRLCERQNLSLDKLTAITELTGNWRELEDAKSETWTEREASLGDELWLFRAVRLPWTSFADAGAVLLMAENISARRERDQARSEALSFVTHELRTPLIAIQGFSELLMRYPGSPAGSEAPATIFRESNRLVAMINTYLEVLRLDAGARPLRRTRVNVSRMLEHVQKVVRPLALAAHTTVKVEVSSENEYLLCDEALISGALLNLVSNAIKYGEAGTDIVLRVTCNQDEVEFAVSNSGPAIPAEDLDHIFERFYRASGSESIPGWGLGLSFVRRICQQHGGRVHVSSNEISGTSFMFVLPRGAYQAAEVAI